MSTSYPYPAWPGFAVIDVETTGFAPERERIVEIAVVLLDERGAEQDHFCTLLDPGGPPGPTHVHGITPEMVVGAPTFSAIHPHLAGLLSGRVVVGHNVDRFDLAFLRAECARTGGGAGLPADLVTLDTLEVAWRFLDLPGKARLVDCCDYFQLAWDDHHSALGDARVTGRLLFALSEHLGADRLDLPTLLEGATAVVWPGAEVSGDRPEEHRRPVRA